ncbi:winged helix-turn-helix transcriptional regulator [Kitasatospora purpeofusca]|uniref:winged helix-turn-helix transcriptional regulator n=1 Tax=Kitasatospora purpeofusca TaxID=67352 RepID=UPI00225A435A|nr:helix-turn-helix domain-containing protein [Kitasatospora purpeofusca]MCX4755897.1 helix-turn-helix transcriptional regulator [Kitasatospora purpeofusca]WSR36252.1 helix-turn-helix transcriptional regulator [Kitasatospora purpeofusca]WSR44541.1 helix-turn-helix transcriptional regulator [Kitasatospora purpeofusca]
MPKRTSHEESTCPVARPLDLLGDGWTLLIVRDAFDGLRRFGQFQKNLGLAKNILSARLANLVAHGVLELAPAADGSPYQEYVLTGKGRALFPVVTAMRQWGERYCFAADEPRARLVDRTAGAPVARVEVRAADGRVLGPDDTEVLLPPE